MIHPARTMPYAELRAGLAHAVADGHVNVQYQDRLMIFTYSKTCAYNRAWTPITEMARGLVFDGANDNVVATPFPKFFNYGERDVPLPNVPFETFEKLDGSLIIIFHHAGRWRAVTKGSFVSDQAQAAQKILDAAQTERLTPGTTYLAEYVGPDNHIVLHYTKSELILLGAYDICGGEATYQQLIDVSLATGWSLPMRRRFDSISDLVECTGKLPSTAEGFVVRFENGYRLKFKGEEYCRLHRLVSNITPLAIWEAMRAGDDLEATRRELPEEFLEDFDSIRELLATKVAIILSEVHALDTEYEEKTDKELGLILDTLPADARQFLFPLRRGEHLLVGRCHERLFRLVRPTGNKLPGYAPSRSMNRVVEEAA